LEKLLLLKIGIKNFLIQTCLVGIVQDPLVDATEDILYHGVDTAGHFIDQSLRGDLLFFDLVEKISGMPSGFVISIVEVWTNLV